MNNLHNIQNKSIPEPYIIWAEQNRSHEYKYENGIFYHWLKFSGKWEEREIVNIISTITEYGFVRKGTGIPANLKIT